MTLLCHFSASRPQNLSLNARMKRRRPRPPGCQWLGWKLHSLGAMPSFCKAVSIIISPHNDAPRPSPRPGRQIFGCQHILTMPPSVDPVGFSCCLGWHWSSVLFYVIRHMREALCALPLWVGAEQEVLCTPSFSGWATLVNISVAWQMFSNYYWQGLSVCLFVFFQCHFAPGLGSQWPSLGLGWVLQIYVCVMGRGWVGTTMFLEKTGMGVTRADVM